MPKTVIDTYHRDPNDNNEPADETVVESKSVQLTFRVAPSVRERVLAAAEETGLSPSDWLRAILLVTLEIHESGENVLDVEPEALVVQAVPVFVPVAAEEVALVDAEYAARVSQAAVSERAALHGRVVPELPVVAKRGLLNPRECAHLRALRSGTGRCPDCGGRIPSRSFGGVGRPRGL